MYMYHHLQLIPLSHWIRSFSFHNLPQSFFYSESEIPPLNRRHANTMRPESLMSSSNSGDERSGAATRCLVRLALRMSRARWYGFLRRVFCYQNGLGSDLGPNPFDSQRWMAMEFVALAVQISVTEYSLMTSRGENPVWAIRIWVVGYALGCLLSFILLCWRIVCLSYVTYVDNAVVDDVEQQRSRQESRILEYLEKCKACLELLFAIWFVMGNVWALDYRLVWYSRAPKLHTLCLSLLAWNALTYSFPLMLFLFFCCCVPMLTTILGYNINKASTHRGASNERLAALPCRQYKDAAENPECCICLAKYKNKEEIRELPCRHIFHRKCVDQWLKIISCCPLCKQGIHE